MLCLKVKSNPLPWYVYDDDKVKDNLTISYTNLQYRKHNIGINVSIKMDKPVPGLCLRSPRKSQIKGKVPRTGVGWGGLDEMTSLLLH